MSHDQRFRWGCRILRHQYVWPHTGGDSLSEIGVEDIKDQAELIKVQSRQLELQGLQFEEQRGVNVEQIRVLKLQAEELGESLAVRKQERRSAEAPRPQGCSCHSRREVSPSSTRKTTNQPSSASTWSLRTPAIVPSMTPGSIGTSAMWKKATRSGSASLSAR